MIQEKVNVQDFPLLDSEGQRTKIVRVPRTEQMFNRIVNKASKCGMKVNRKKTTVLCISDAISFKPRVVMDVGGGKK